jgi:hypothetical protein
MLVIIRRIISIFIVQNWKYTWTWTGSYSECSDANLPQFGSRKLVWYLLWKNEIVMDNCSDTENRQSWFLSLIFILASFYVRDSQLVTFTFYYWLVVGGLSPIINPHFLSKRSNGSNKLPDNFYQIYVLDKQTNKKYSVNKTLVLTTKRTDS